MTVIVCDHFLTPLYLVRRVLKWVHSGGARISCYRVGAWSSGHGLHTLSILKTRTVHGVFCRYSGAAWGNGLHVWLVLWRSWVRALSKATVVSLSKKLYPYCLSLGRFQERIRAWFHNRTIINWGPYGRLTCMSISLELLKRKHYKHEMKKNMFCFCNGNTVDTKHWYED